jgi:hypothetical protein
MAPSRQGTRGAKNMSPYQKVVAIVIRMIAIGIIIYGLIFVVSTGFLLHGFPGFPMIFFVYSPTLFGLVLYALAKPLASLITRNL